MQHPNTVAVEWAKNLELLPAVCREFISNPGSQDHLGALCAPTQPGSGQRCRPVGRRSLGRSSRSRGSTSAPSFWVPEAAGYRIDRDRPGSQEAGRGSAGCGNRSGVLRMGPFCVCWLDQQLWARSGGGCAGKGEACQYSGGDAGGSSVLMGDFDDDTSLSLLSMKMVKAVLDVGLYESMCWARWGATKWVQNEPRAVADTHIRCFCQPSFLANLLQHGAPQFHRPSFKGTHGCCLQEGLFSGEFQKALVLSKGWNQWRPRRTHSDADCRLLDRPWQENLWCLQSWLQGSARWIRARSCSRTRMVDCHHETIAWRKEGQQTRQATKASSTHCPVWTTVATWICHHKGKARTRRQRENGSLQENQSLEHWVEGIPNNHCLRVIFSRNAWNQATRRVRNQRRTRRKCKRMWCQTISSTMASDCLNMSRRALQLKHLVAKWTSAWFVAGFAVILYMLILI